MLLYTRLAPPKIPKKRSRGGCTYCKEKKKKCNEERPQCSRCIEKGHECVYEPVKPRQRRRREAEGRANDLESRSSDSSTLGLTESAFGPWNRDLRSGSGVVGVGRPELRIDPRLLASLDVFDDSPVSPDENSQLQLASPDDPVFSPSEQLSFEAQLSAGLESNFDDQQRRSSTSASELMLAPQSRSMHSLCSPVTSAFVETPCLEFVYPGFSEFADRPNRRALVYHFCNVLSHLIVFKEDAGNPFQRLVLPLCHRSDAVRNALFALASAHLEYRGIEGTEKSVQFHNKSIQGLARLIEQGSKANKNELLASIMLLVYYEVLVQHGRSNIVEGHLRGAMTVMNTSSESSDTTTLFLERAFRFYDVIAALSLGTSPLSKAPDAGGFAPFPPMEYPASPLSNVDTLLGMATSLWPIIHRLSTLLSLKNNLESAIASNDEPTKISALRTEFETTSHAIDVSLKQWQPTLPSSFVMEDDDGDGFDAERAAERARLQSILNNALAYRHSAFVYLYRTIYGYPRRHELVQRHAHVALTHCVSTVVNAGPMGALLWPLFVASCEAVSLGDRDLARQAFLAVDQRQGMTNIERAWVIVQEVWRRADAEEASRSCSSPQLGSFSHQPTLKGRDLWRRVSEDMGMAIVFG